MSTPRKRSTTGKARSSGTGARAHRAPRSASEPGWSGRDLLTPYVLLAISTRKAHGYFIEQYLRSLGLAQVEMTTLYRMLRQLEKDGLVRSVWEAQAGGPARRVYTLTGTGRALLDTGASYLEQYRHAIDTFFGTYGATAKRKERGG
ncbi:MAG: PadR family transcriptional regulator [Chloroflexota bacterium]|nr:PadR family transcriptional regulator [Chloroflexota bacterium]